MPAAAHQSPTCSVHAGCSSLLAAFRWPGPAGGRSAGHSSTRLLVHDLTARPKRLSPNRRQNIKKRVEGRRKREERDEGRGKRGGWEVLTNSVTCSVCIAAFAGTTMVCHHALTLRDRLGAFGADYEALELYRLPASGGGGGGGTVSSAGGSACHGRSCHAPLLCVDRDANMGHHLAVGNSI